jgi:mono/diheme cytochrome c family protein
MEASSASTPAFSGNETMPPADFTVPGMLAQNPARWQGKILRGGMGTGMPYWGPIFTDAQTWALVDYLWTFSMEYSYAKK